MPEEEYAFMPQKRLMQADEIVHLARLFVEQGVTKIRLTGGEPLVRKDAGAILQALGELGVELSITTNGTRLHLFINELQQANIHTINISLDTLQEDKFLLITRRDEFNRVASNIAKMLHHGFQIRINVVVVKGLNDTEILDFIDWTKNSPVKIRFIEFMPFDGNRWKSDKLVTLQDMLNIISTKYSISEAENTANDTSKNYHIKGHQGSFAIISTMSAPFCSSCNRIRLTADGKIKNCLFAATETDLLEALRSGKDVLPLIQSSIQAKHKELGGQFSGNFELIDAAALHNRSMIAIGG